MVKQEQTVHKLQIATFLDPNEFLGPPSPNGTFGTIRGPHNLFGTPLEYLGTPGVFLGPPGLFGTPGKL